jgi:DNA-binding response OmpR family regulator
MDVLMPEKDGLQACYEIKANLATKDIPVVMLTAIDLEMNKKLAANWGADGYMTKPFTPQELLDAVTQFLKSTPNS